MQLDLAHQFSLYSQDPLAKPFYVKQFNNPASVVHNVVLSIQ